MFIRNSFKGINKRILDKYDSKEEVPVELRSIYEALLNDQDKNGVPDVFDENGRFKQALENEDIFIVSKNNLDSLPADAREKYEALMSDQNYSSNNYGLDNLHNENSDLNQTRHNALDDITDEDVGIYRRNQNNSSSGILVLVLMVFGLIILGVMLFS